MMALFIISGSPVSSDSFIPFLLCTIALVISCMVAMKASRDENIFLMLICVLFGAAVGIGFFATAKDTINYVYFHKGFGSLVFIAITGGSCFFGLVLAKAMGNRLLNVPALFLGGVALLSVWALFR